MNQSFGFGFQSGGSGGGGGGLNLIYVTKAEADALIATNGVIKGNFYQISGVNTSLYGGTTIIVQGVANNAFSEEGNGQFFNPNYNQSVAGYGIWSNISTWSATLTSGTFQPNEAVTADNGATATLFTNLDANQFISISGDWTTASTITGNSSGATANISSVVLASYNVGSTVFWGGKAWTNTTGNVGNSTDLLTLDATDWTVISYSDTTQYNTVWDEIKYDYANDLIIYRKDVANNVVSTSKGNEQYNSDNYTPFPCIAVFQWGNPYNYFIGLGVGENTVDGAYCENVNFNGSTFIYNTLSNNSYLSNNTLSNSSNFNNNTLSSSSSFNYNTLSNSSFGSNTLSGGSYFYNNNLSGGSIFGNNELNSGSSIQNSLLNDGTLNNIQYNTLSGGSSIDGVNMQNSSAIQNNTLTEQSSYNNVTISGGAVFKWNKIQLNFTYNTSPQTTDITKQVFQ